MGKSSTNKLPNLSFIDFLFNWRNLFKNQNQQIMRYYVLLMIDIPKGGTSRRKAEIWLDVHMENMTSDTIGCFKEAKSKTITIDGNYQREDLLVSYKLRDRDALNRYERQFAKKMRNDPTRPKGIKVIARWKG